MYVIYLWIVLLSLQFALLTSTSVTTVNIDGQLVDFNASTSWKTKTATKTQMKDFQMVFVNESAATFSWKYDFAGAISSIPTMFLVELAVGADSDDFQYFGKLSVSVPSGFSNISYYSNYTVYNLNADSNYRVQILPLLPSGRGNRSPIVTFRTLLSAVNYFEPILGRRYSIARYGIGFTNPVVDRPHLTPGVEIFDERVSSNPLRYSDSPTSEIPVFPSGRRGESLSTIEQFVFMFGGRTNGYSCADIYKDTINFGNTESGRYVSPCSYQQLEVDELWSFDLRTYEWRFINTSWWHPLQPSSREQHSAAVINGDLYIYGGKRRLVDATLDGRELNGTYSDQVYGDIWKLSVERAAAFSLSWPNETMSETGATRAISQTQAEVIIIDGRSNGNTSQQSDGVNSREGLCVDKLQVRLSLNHACMKQVRISLVGPGPLVASPNYFTSGYTNEVLLFDQIPTNGTSQCASGSHSFIFDDESLRLPEVCCTQQFKGLYKPEGKLAEFIGATMSSEWKLLIQDTALDSLTGVVQSWGIDFIASPCAKRFVWSNLSAVASVSAGTLSPPPARYQAKIISYDKSLFIFGGRDISDRVLNDLYRYDIDTNKWTVLNPIKFDMALGAASGTGQNFLLTSWGLIRFGGYYRQPRLSVGDTNYGNSIFVMDPVTMRWRSVEVLPSPHSDATFGRKSPAPRYLGAMAFVPSHLLRWRTTYFHRNLYDQPLPSSRTNYQGAISDSILLYGGFDSAAGSLYDGASGGYLNDLWMVRFSNWSTDGSRYHQQRYLETHCAWRNSATAKQYSKTHTCVGSAGTDCELRDLIMLAWCTASNQTMA